MPYSSTALNCLPSIFRHLRTLELLYFYWELLRSARRRSLSSSVIFGRFHSSTIFHTVARRSRPSPPPAVLRDSCGLFASVPQRRRGDPRRPQPWCDWFERGIALQRTSASFDVNVPYVWNKCRWHQKAVTQQLWNIFCGFLHSSLWHSRYDMYAMETGKGNLSMHHTESIEKNVFTMLWHWHRIVFYLTFQDP